MVLWIIMNKIINNRKGSSISPQEYETLLPFLLLMILFILENTHRDFHSHRLHRVDGLAYGQIPAET